MLGCCHPGQGWHWCHWDVLVVPHLGHGDTQGALCPWDCALCPWDMSCATHVCDRWQPWWHSGTRPQHGCQTDDNPKVPPHPVPPSPCATIITPCPHHHPVPPTQDTRGSPRVRSSPSDTLRAPRSTSQVTTPKCHITHPCHHHHPKVPPSPCVTTIPVSPPPCATPQNTHVPPTCGSSPSDTLRPSLNSASQVPTPKCHLAHPVSPSSPCATHPGHTRVPLTPRDHTPPHCQPGDSP